MIDADDPTEASPTSPGVERAVESRPSRVPLILATVVSVLVLGAALVAPLITRAIGYAPAPVDLSEVQTWEITDRSHAFDDVAYPQNPPAGGRHAPVWLACGTYDVPVRDENAVHDLEHGALWITHDPDLSDAEVSVLAEQLPENSILSPREGLPSPVVVTVWGRQLQLDGAYDRRLALFVEEYGDGHTAPEFGASCEGGTPDPTGEIPEPGTNA